MKHASSDYGIVDVSIYSMYCDVIVYVYLDCSRTFCVVYYTATCFSRAAERILEAQGKTKSWGPPPHRVGGVSPPSSRGDWGHAPPGKFEILGTLRCVLRPSEVVQFMHAK